MNYIDDRYRCKVLKLLVRVTSGEAVQSKAVGSSWDSTLCDKSLADTDFAIAPTFMTPSTNSSFLLKTAEEGSTSKADYFKKSRFTHRVMQ